MVYHVAQTIAQVAAILIPALKENFKLVLINLVVLIVISGAIEVILRAFPPDWLLHRMDSFVSRVSNGKKGEFGSDSSWKIEKVNGRFVSFKPGSSLLVSHEEYIITAHIDDDGLRTVSPVIRDSSNSIPIFGDSFVFGVGVEDWETFPSLLQNEMDNCRLLNFGVPGSSLRDQLFIIRNRFKEFTGIKDVCFAFYLGNDFEDMIRAEKLLNEKIKSGIEKKVDRNMMWEINNFVNKSKILNKSYLIQFIKVQLLKVYNKYSSDSKVLLAGFSIMNKKEKDFYMSWKKAANSAFSELSQLEDSLGFVSHFIIIPQKYNIDSAGLKVKADYYGIDYGDLDPLRPAKIITEMLMERSFDFIDLTTCLEAGGGNDLYFVHDGHFNKNGNAVTSECLSAFIRKVCID